MSSDVVASTTIAEKVADRIREQFLELIPPEEFTRMVKTQLEWFTTAPPKRNSYDKDTVSPLNKILREELEKLFRPAIHAAINEWNADFDATGKALAGEAAKKLVTENADAILASMMSGLVQAALNDFRELIGQRLNSGSF